MLRVGKGRGRRGMVWAASVSYETEATDLFARFTTAPDDTRKGHINTLIAGLKTDGLWTKLDGLWLLACHGSTEADKCLNWKSTSYPLAKTGTVTFTTDQGAAGDGTTGYLTATSYAPAGGGVQYVLNSAVLGCWVRTAATTVGYEVDMGTARCRKNDASNTWNYRVNDGTTATPAVAASTGHFMATRSASNARFLYRNGAQVATDATASTSIAGSAFRLFATTGVAGTFSNAQLAAAYVGSGMDATQASNLHTRLNTYLTAIGAA